MIAPLGDLAEERVRSTIKWWTGWGSRCGYDERHREAVIRSAVVPRHLVSARTYRLFRAEAFEAWRNAAGVAA